MRTSVLDPNLKRAIFVVSDKGGVGKSRFTEALLDYYISKGAEIDVNTLDGSVVGGLTRRCGKFSAPDSNGNRVYLHPQPKNGVTAHNLLGTDDDKDRIAEIFRKPGISLNDCPATTLTTLEQMDWTIPKIASKHKCELVIACVVSGDDESIENIRKAMDYFGKDAMYNVVLNEFFGEIDAGDFDTFFGDGVKRGPSSAKLELDAMGDRAVVTRFPRLNPKARNDVVDLRLRFPEALDHDEITGPHQLRIEKWIERCEESFAPADHLFGLAPWPTEHSAEDAA